MQTLHKLIELNMSGHCCDCLTAEPCKYVFLVQPCLLKILLLSGLDATPLNSVSHLPPTTPIVVVLHGLTGGMPFHVSWFVMVLRLKDYCAV